MALCSEAGPEIVFALIHGNVISSAYSKADARSRQSYCCWRGRSEAIGCYQGMSVYIIGVQFNFLTGHLAVVENSIDAGANRISVVLGQGGLN